VTLTPLDAALDQADVICVLVKHDAFRDLAARLPEGVPVVDVVGL